MNERLLQYIWQLQYFNLHQLTTTAGEALIIIHPGNNNSNQGPDFLDARVKVNDTILAGNIELHTKSSNWNDHHHTGDSNYKNVILHVVWVNDVELDLPFPVLELQSKVPGLLLSKFDELMIARSFISCEKMISQVEPLLWTSWKERLLVERLQIKATNIAAYLNENNNHWEETFWWLVARNFGIPVNTEGFEKLARSLPLVLLSKHRSQLNQIEALLFGQAGLLDARFAESYPLQLQKEFRFLKRKYGLKPIHIPIHLLRMRPSNFPTLRLAQLAGLVHKSVHLFALVKETIYLKDLYSLLNVTASGYWDQHYVFEETTALKQKHLGRQMADTIIINTIIPMLFAYGLQHKEQELKDRALNWLAELPPEINRVTRSYSNLGVLNENAFDSQSLLQLKKSYCDQKRCLECSIGTRLLKPVN